MAAKSPAAIETPEPPTLPERLRDADTIGGVVLAIGSPLSRFFEYLEHVGFLMSAANQQFGTALGFWNNTGWWAITAIGIVWLLYRLFGTNIKVHQGLTWPFVIAASFVTFIFGVVVAVTSSGAVPNVIAQWGPGCNAVIDTSRLTSFEDQYKLVLVCLAPDPTIDPLSDKQIIVSNEFEITGATVSIFAPPSESYTAHEMRMTGTVGDPKTFYANGMKSGQMTFARPASTNYLPVLLPNSVGVDKIASLDDARKLGGKILNPIYYK